MECQYCFEKQENCICVWTKCAECGKRIPESHASEYRGRVWCEDAHNFDEQVAKRNFERAEVMEIENHKTAPFKGLDMSNDSVIGKANRQILKKQIEISKKESAITRRYERGF